MVKHPSLRPSQLYDKAEMLECIRKLVEVDQEWVPYSLDASLYIRPTFIGIEVRSIKERRNKISIPSVL